MISKLSLSIIFVLLSFLIPNSTSSVINQVADNGSLPSFTYTGNSGPGRWGGLCPQYSKCRLGIRQSPVNIDKSEVFLNKKLKPLTRYYNPANATLVNNGFNIGIHYEEEAGFLEIYGKKFTLKQMHWHSPSEHKINGLRFPAELHLVHRADDGSLSVVAILFQYSEPDPLLTKIKKKVDELAKEVWEGNEAAHVSIGTLDLKLLKKQTKKYYRYVGSLTTPPCSEKVIWNILGKVRGISKEQVDTIKAPLHSEYKNNARPCQPVNGRKIELYSQDD